MIKITFYLEFLDVMPNLSSISMDHDQLEYCSLSKLLGKDKTRSTCYLLFYDTYEMISELIDL